MTTSKQSDTETPGGGALLFGVFALIVLSIVAACIVVGDQAHAAPADITIAPCSMAHIPADTRTDVCVNTAGDLVRR